MATEVYGASDDLIEIEGDVQGELCGSFGADGEGEPCLLMFNDGTILRVVYGKAERGIWSVTCINRGPLFDRIETCEDEDAKRYSDTAFLKDGAKFAYAATKWQKVQ